MLSDVKTFALVILLSAFLAQAEEPLGKKFSASGDLVVTRFESAPFPHSSRANGHKYQNVEYSAEKHYSDNTVALFIPRVSVKPTEVNFVIHFHGWRNTATNALSQFSLIQQFAASHRNAVLIAPQGPREAPDSSGGKLEDANGFKSFVDEALALLKQRGDITREATVGKIILSGHSGGYRVISSILEHGGLSDSVREVWLFDGLYGRTEQFLNWSERTGGRFINIYTDNGGTKDETEKMIATLKQRGKKLWATSDRVVLPRELRANKLLFLHSDLGHSEVIDKRRTFQTFLETSCLEPREGKAAAAK